MLNEWDVVLVLLNQFFSFLLNFSPFMQIVCTKDYIYK